MAMRLVEEQVEDPGAGLPLHVGERADVPGVDPDRAGVAGGSSGGPPARGPLPDGRGSNRAGRRLPRPIDCTGSRGALPPTAGRSSGRCDEMHRYSAPPWYRCWRSARESSRCSSPSRCALMTGPYPAETQGCKRNAHRCPGNRQCCLPPPLRCCSCPSPPERGWGAATIPPGRVLHHAGSGRDVLSAPIRVPDRHRRSRPTCRRHDFSRCRRVRSDYGRRRILVAGCLYSVPYRRVFAPRTRQERTDHMRPVR